MLLGCFSLTAQNSGRDTGTIALTVVQDGRLTIMKDESGNVPFTLDITTKLEFRLMASEVGYFSIIPNVEYAELKGGYFFSYGVWGGYTFDNFLVLPTFGALNEEFIDIHIMPYAGYNIINRKFENTPHINGWEPFGSIHLGTEVVFKVHEKVGVVWDFKFNNRNDLKYQFDSFDEFLSFNFAVGVKYDF